MKKVLRYWWQKLTVASIIFRLRVASIFVTRVTRKKKPLQSDSQNSKNIHALILNGLNSQLNYRMTSLPVNFRFYRMLKISISKIFLALFRVIFDLRHHLVVDILNFEPFVTRVTDMDATVKLVRERLAGSQWTQNVTQTNDHKVYDRTLSNKARNNVLEYP